MIKVDAAAVLIESVGQQQRDSRVVEAMALTFEDSDLVAEHRQLDIIVALGSLAGSQKIEDTGRVRCSRG